MAPSPASKPLLRAAPSASSIASAPSAAHASTTSFALFAVLMLAQIGTSCDNGAMSVAVTSLMAELGASLADVQIANTVYDLVAGAFMLVGGMLGILIGWRRNLRIGLLFALCGEMCATLAPNMAVLTWGGRVLVGLGASLIIPSVLGMIPALYESRRRAIAFSGIAGAAALATLSPLPFGALVDAGGFRVPFVVLAVYFAFILLATKALPAVRIPASGLKLDPGGIALASAGIMLLLLGMSRLPTWGVITPTAASPFTVFGLSPSLPLAAAGAILLVALVAYERRIERMTGCALIPRSFLASPHVRSGLLAVFVPFFYLGAYLILLIPYLQLVGGYTATQAGLVSALSTVPMFLLAVLLPKIMPHTSSRLIIRIGFALLALAFLLMGLGVGGGANTTLLLIGVFLGGCGVGTVNSQANNAVASAVVGRDAQQSGGIQGAARNIGLAMGNALAGTALLLALSGHATAALEPLSLPDAESTAVGEQASSLVDKTTFAATLTQLDLTSEQRAALATAQERGQTSSMQFTFYLLAAIALACQFGTRGLRETAVPRLGAAEDSEETTS